MKITRRLCYSLHQPWFSGIRFALLIATWEAYRLPVAFRLIRVKTPPEYRTENALFREMVSHVVPPPWAKKVMVEGDAAYGSRENMPMVLKRDMADPARRWGFVFAMARTGTTVEDKAIKDLVTHWPRPYYQRIRVPRLSGTTGCKTCWVYSTRLCLRYIGDVTVVLRKKGRNVGPKHTKILVTNLDEWTPRQVGSNRSERATGLPPSGVPGHPAPCANTLAHTNSGFLGYGRGASMAARCWS